MANVGTQTGPKTAAEAFASANWKEVMPELLKNAIAYLHKNRWGETETTKSGTLEAEELVNEAMMLLLSGDRTWVPGVVTTQKGLIAFISMTMKSIVTNARTGATIARREGGLASVQAIERVPDRTHGPHAQMIAKGIIAEVRAAIAGDPQLVRYVEALAEGITKREDVKRKLKLSSVDDVSVIQKRMRRLLAARGITIDGTDEPQAPDGYADGDEHDDEEVES